MELKKLNAKIKALGTKTAKWRDEVQVVLVACALHSFEDGNVDPATRVVAALKGADITAVIHWFEKNTPCIWVRSENQFRLNKSFNGEYDAVLLLATPWWELAKDSKDVNSTFDCLALVRGLIKRIENEVASGKREVQHVEALDELKAVAGKLEKVA